jgi:hypothetical protein
MSRSEARFPGSRRGTAPSREPDASGRETAPIRGSLKPFRGSFTSGISFSSGHSFWLFRFESTPTSFGAYDGIWAITPDGRRVLYADPAGVERVASTYHEFDRAVGAAITWGRTDEEVVELRVDGDDGTTVDLRVRLGASAGARLFNALIALAPRAALRTRVGAALCNLVIAGAVEANGLKVVGLTEPDEPYRFEADRLRAVEGARVSVYDTDLGEPRAPERPSAVGDVRAPEEPFFATGSLFLRPPATRATRPTTRTRGSEAVAASPSRRSR